MLHVPVGSNSFGLMVPSWGTTRPANSYGTSVTAGTSDFGSWVNILSALGSDAYGLMVMIGSASGSGASRQVVVNIGVDEAGGSSYVTKIPSLLGGASPTYLVATGGSWYFFPLYVPAGSTIGAQAYSSIALSPRVAVVSYEKPPNPAMIRKGSFVEAIGVSGNNGTSVTMGTTSEGSWQSLGTTSRRLWWWQYGVQLDPGETNVSGSTVHVDLAVGSSQDVIFLDNFLSVNSSEAIGNSPITSGVEWDVPAGSTIYVRCQSAASADSFQFAAYGLGG